MKQLLETTCRYEHKLMYAHYIHKHTCWTASSHSPLARPLLLPRGGDPENSSIHPAFSRDDRATPQTTSAVATTCRNVDYSKEVHL